MAKGCAIYHQNNSPAVRISHIAIITNKLQARNVILPRIRQLANSGYRFIAASAGFSRRNVAILSSLIVIAINTKSYRDNIFFPIRVVHPYLWTMGCPKRSIHLQQVGQANV